MYGIDTSHWQGDYGNIDWKKVKASKFDFAIIKASEATSFIDPMFLRDKKYAREAGMLLGFYHFARGVQSPEEEARHFLRTVGDIREGEILVLDWEVENSNPVGWCLSFLKYVEGQVGFKPLIYMSSAVTTRYDWSPVVKNNNGLWVARYGLNDGEKNDKYPPSTGPWSFYAIWQFTSRGRVSGINGNVDINYAKMDADTFKKYGKKKEEVTPPTLCKNDSLQMNDNLKKAMIAIGVDDIGENIDLQDRDRVAQAIFSIKDRLSSKEGEAGMLKNKLEAINNIIKG